VKSVADFLERLMGLWTEPIGTDEEARASFGSLYADPVQVNGADLALADLIARARLVQAAFGDLNAEIVEQVSTPESVVVGFYLRGRHVGPWVGPLGTVPPTGLAVSVRTTDILTVRDGLVTGIWVVADELSLLMQLDAVALRPAPGPAPRTE
jgi:predicted ester cyclase